MNSYLFAFWITHHGASEMLRSFGGSDHKSNPIRYVTYICPSHHTVCNQKVISHIKIFWKRVKKELIIKFYWFPNFIVLYHIGFSSATCCESES